MIKNRRWSPWIIITCFAAVLGLNGFLFVRFGNSSIAPAFSLFAIPTVIVAFFYPRWVYMTLGGLALVVSLVVASYLTGERFTLQLGIVFGVLTTQVVSEIVYRLVRARRRVEKALRTSEERYALATQAAKVGVWDWDLRTGDFYIDSNLKAILGYTENEIPNDLEAWSGLVHPDDRQAVMETAQAHMDGLTPEYTYEHRMLHKDGSVRWILVRGTAVRDEQGTAVRLVGTDTDVTARKRAELALQENQANLMAVLENTQDAIWSVDAERRLLTFNAAFAEVYKTALDVWPEIGMESAVRFPPPVRETWLAWYDRALTGERFTVEAEYDFWGPKRCYEISFNPIRQAREVDGVTGFARDITERKQVELELRRSHEDLQQFAYVVSHDLQEPLRMIISFLELLKRNYDDLLDERGQEYIWYAVDGATRMQAMIEGLLAYSRIDTQGNPFTSTDCNVILEHVLRNLMRVIQAKDAVVTYDPLPTINVDATQVEQVFQNLISNALKFCDVSPPRVHISAERNDHLWRFAVRDNGIGIDPAQMDRLFKVFERLHTQEEYEGTGIGLAVCKKIVERHGGQIWVESQPGEGSIFYFTLPPYGGE